MHKATVIKHTRENTHAPTHALSPLLLTLDVKSAKRKKEKKRIIIYSVVIKIIGSIPLTNHLSWKKKNIIYLPLETKVQKLLEQTPNRWLEEPKQASQRHEYCQACARLAAVLF